MKAFKILLITALVSFSMIGFGQGINKSRQALKSAMIPLTQIDLNSDLGTSIIKQVNPDDLLDGGERSGMYVAVVRFDGATIKVYGSYWQWFRFLKLRYRTNEFVGEGVGL